MALTAKSTSECIKYSVNFTFIILAKSARYFLPLKFRGRENIMSNLYIKEINNNN